MSQIVSAPYRLFVVEDHEMMRYALVRMIGCEADLSVCGQAGSAEEALPLIRQARPQLVLVDVTLPGMDGVELVGCLQEEKQPPLCLVVSGHREEMYGKAVYQAGARGYVRKDRTAEIMEAIYVVLKGGVYFSDRVRRELGL